MDPDVIKNIHSSPWQFVIAVTGGGSSAISELLKVPGASQSIIDAQVPYHANALGHFLGAAPTKYCSSETARSMAMRAFMRLGELIPDSDPGFRCGVACTAALATDHEKKGDHAIHLAMQTQNMTRCISVTLEKGQWTREQEEALACELLIASLAEIAGSPLPESPFSEVDGTLKEEKISLDTIGKQQWGKLLTGETQMVPDRSLPKKFSIFPGAFDPVHQGHFAMADVAEEITGVPTCFEISMLNVDKPAIDYLEMQERASRISPDRGLCFTRTPTFLEKVQLFPQHTFIVGTDTLVRIAEPQYYGSDKVKMYEAFQFFKESGCRFLAFGRLAGPDLFQSLDDLDIPPELAELCTEVPEEKFRMDISSTEIRQARVT